jgi:tRNA modification GTPase
MVEQGGETIVALATPRGRGALAVVRVSGTRAHGVVGETIRDNERFVQSGVGKLRRYELVDEEGETVDEITAVKYRAPRSFTGEDMVELICHGSEEIVRTVMGQLVSKGARFAGRGEFTRRAFLNGKTDLMRAEAINQIVEGRTLRGVRRAMRNYLGGYEGRVREWEKALIAAVGDFETVIEFGEEDHVGEHDLVGRSLERLRELKREAHEELAGRRDMVEADEGVEIALVGPPNAGKSTILNRLVGYERALVHASRGTTRDSVSERVRMGAIDARIVDTAGLRRGAGEVERMGVERTWEYVRSAVVVVWVTAADEGWDEEETRIIQERPAGGRIVAIVNKADRGGGAEKVGWLRERGIEAIETAAIEEASREGLGRFIGEAVMAASQRRDADTIIGTERQAGVVARMLEEIERALETAPRSEEVLSFHCRRALEHLEELTGKRTTDEILDRVFGEFCIGK